jgi:hypothetical protein
MSDLTPTQQGIMDLVDLEGPMTREKIASTCWPGISLAEAVAFTKALDSLLSHTLLQEWRQIVECGRCDEGWSLTYRTDEGEPMRCLECDSGSMEEWMIGRPCRYCAGKMGFHKYATNDPSGRARRWVICSCSSTPIPGLDPGYR